MTDIAVEATTVAWTDYTSRSPRSEGAKSRLHRVDTSQGGRYTACGVRVPTFGAARRVQPGAQFEITAEESTGQCRRCFPRSCVLCRRRKAVGECCSSHAKRLCHTCYRRWHYVEVCAVSCPRCAAEGLPRRIVSGAP